jgi:hypothetical protein
MSRLPRSPAVISPASPFPKDPRTMTIAGPPDELACLNETRSALSA